MLIAQAPLRQQQKIVGQRVEVLVRGPQRSSGTPAVDLFRRDILSALPRLQNLLLRAPRAVALERALEQADWRISVTTFVLLSAVIGGALYVTAQFFWNFLPLSLTLAALGVCVPYSDPELQAAEALRHLPAAVPRGHRPDRARHPGRPRGSHGLRDGGGRDGTADVATSSAAP